MSHGVHAVQHEVEHEIKSGNGHGEHGGHRDPLDSRNKKVALLIAVIALFLAFSETLGKSAQTGAISYNVEGANLWAFFQAKNIRRTTVLTAAEEMAINAAAVSDPGIRGIDDAADRHLAEDRGTLSLRAGCTGGHRRTGRAR